MWVRTKSIYGEPLWVIVTVGAPLFTSMALSLLYQSSGVSSYTGFAILGGVMISFWGNVLWSMASQFMWDKQAGLFEVYITSPAPISAILVGMSLGGVLGTAPSAALVALLGWAIFNPPILASWTAVLVVFALTLASLYAMGMALSSLYLVYGREADSINEALHEPVSYLSGVYFPQSALQFPAAVQIAASLIPLTVGMDALRRTLFLGEGVAQIPLHIGLLALMAGVLLVLSQKLLKVLEERGRKVGTISVRIR